MSENTDWNEIFEQELAIQIKKGLTGNEARAAAAERTEERRKWADNEIHQITGGKMIFDVDGDPIGAESTKHLIGKFDSTGLPIAMWVDRDELDHEDADHE